MRKLILNLFALNYRFKLVVSKFSVPRISTWIYPTVLLLSLLCIKHFEEIYITITWIVIAILSFFGFIYFKIRPIEYYNEDLEYLDESQKNQYMVLEKFQQDNGTYESNLLLLLWILLNPVWTIIFIYLMMSL